MEMILQQVVMEWVKVHQNSNFVNKTIAELEIRRKTGVSIIAIREGREGDPKSRPLQRTYKGRRHTDCGRYQTANESLLRPMRRM